MMWNSAVPQQGARGGPQTTSHLGPHELRPWGACPQQHCLQGLCQKNRLPLTSRAHFAPPSERGFLCPLPPLWHVVTRSWAVGGEQEPRPPSPHFAHLGGPRIQAQTCPELGRRVKESLGASGSQGLGKLRSGEHSWGAERRGGCCWCWGSGLWPHHAGQPRVWRPLIINPGPGP